MGNSFDVLGSDKNVTHREWLGVVKCKKTCYRHWTSKATKNLAIYRYCNTRKKTTMSIRLSSTLFYTSQPPVDHHGHIGVSWARMFPKKNQFWILLQIFFNGHIFSGKEHHWESLFFDALVTLQILESTQRKNHQSKKARRKNLAMKWT